MHDHENSIESDRFVKDISIKLGQVSSNYVLENNLDKIKEKEEEEEKDGNSNKYCYNYVSLFDPCPLLSREIDMIEKCLIDSIDLKENTENINDNLQLSCCDFGCGVGRDDIWLSLRKIQSININKSKIKISWKITCIDNKMRMLSKLDIFAKRVGKRSQIEIVNSINGKIAILDVDDSNNPKIFDFINKGKNKNTNKNNDSKTNNSNKKDDCPLLNELKYDLLLCVRFLHNFINVINVIKSLLMNSNHCHQLI